MDIRKWLTKKPTTTTSNSSVKPSSSSAKKTTSRVIIDSDSDEEMNMRTKKKPAESKSRNKKKRIIDSSDESDDGQNAKKSKKDEVSKNRRSMRMHISDSSAEEFSPVKRKSSPVKQKPSPVKRKSSPVKQKPSPVKRKSSPVKSKLKPQNKQDDVKYTSKFFKEMSANDAFGNEPVKRSDKKLKELQEKLKTFKPAKKDPIVDDDADFEAALLQLDEIGDNWVDLPKVKENGRSTSSNKNSDKSPVKKNSVPEKQKNVQSSKVKKDSKETSRQLDSLSSGYGSADSFALSSNSHSLDDSSTEQNSSVVVSKLENSDVKIKTKKEVAKTTSKTSPVLVEKKKEIKSVPLDKSVKEASPVPSLPGSSSDSFSLWVEKHKPQSSKKIIGQQGEKSNVNKLIHWLKNWYKNNAGSKKATFVPGGWNKDPTGACFKAALLSGPPGVGKTTTVSLVCKELGFDLVEFNASDTRSKKLLQEEVSELLKCTSLTPFFTKQNSESGAVTKKHVLVMDEVDGMAGNEDRGGIQELIQLIKFTKIPIICMCNDRNHPKIRSLVNYCFDLRFSRPRVEQIKGYMMSVCFKEKLRIRPEALVDIITSANNDVRLVLNHLSMLAASENTQNLEAAKKYVKLSAWDVLRKVFSKEDHKNMSIHDKCDLFFFDYSIAPLFVQENYLSIKPLNPEAQNKRKKMELYARAAKCIGLGDLIDHRIRKNSSWSLLPTQAIFASYAPGEILEGYCSAQINFPSWLGKNSKQGRMDRLLQEVQIHTRLKISGSKESVNLDYAAHLKNRILGPLVERGTDGVKDALDVLHEYDLLKEDLDSIQEICQWPNSVNTMATVETKVKSAFTRAYNKNPPVRPYSLSAPIKKAATIESLPDDDGDDAEENEKSDDDTDAMIVVKKKPTAKKLDDISASTSKATAKTNTSDDIPASTSKAKRKPSTSTAQSKRSRKK